MLALEAFDKGTLEFNKYQQRLHVRALIFLFHWQTHTTDADALQQYVKVKNPFHSPKQTTRVRYYLSPARLAFLVTSLSIRFNYGYIAQEANAKSVPGERTVCTSRAHVVLVKGIFAQESAILPTE